MALGGRRTGILFGSVGAVLLLFAFLGQLVGVRAAIFWGHLLAGLGLLAIAAATSLAELQALFRRDASRRGIRFGGNALAQLVAILVILGVAVFLALRHPVRWDWTAGQIESLSQATLDVLEQIPEERPVEVLAFYTQGGQSSVRELLGKYSYESDRLRFEIHDPKRRPDLAELYEIRREGILVVCGGPCKTVKGKVRVLEESENEITKAIRSVISEQKKVYFLTGHGEANPEDQEETGCSLAVGALEDENIEVNDLFLAQLGEVPDDADAVVVAGPNRSLLRRELEALDLYLRAGGGLLVMAEPIVVTKLEDRVRDWGIELGNDIVVDEQIHLFAGPQLGVQPLVATYGDHPITEAFTADSSGIARHTTFPLARSVRSASEEPDPDLVELALTGPASWAETNVELFTNENAVSMDPDEDREGPIALAVARTLESSAEDQRAGRIVVVGDSDFVRNRHAAEFFNGDLFVNMVNWLVGEEAFTTIERRFPRASMVTLSVEQYATFRYLSIFLLPELILLIGLWIWWRRRA